MLFPKRQDTIETYTGTASLGNTISFSITREFFLDTVEIVIPITIASATSAPVFTSYGLWEIVKLVQLTIADGSSNRTQTSASGAALIRRSGKICNGLDINTQKCSGAYLTAIAAQSATAINGSYVLTIPLHFKHPQISDPIGSAFMLPVPRYNTNPTLTVQFDAQTAAISTANGAVVTIGTPYLNVTRRQVDNVQFPTLETEFIELVYQAAATGVNFKYDMQVPGSYTNIDMLLKNSSNVATDISSGVWTLQILGNYLRKFYLRDIQTEEQRSQGNDLYMASDPDLAPVMPGFYHLDFLHDGYGLEVGELGSVLNTNLLAGSGSLLQMIMGFASTGTVAFACERVFGDLSPYKLNFNTAAG